MTERTQLRESIIRRSGVYQNYNTSSNRSFISTALVNDSMAYGDDLRKSRIQNLPNYKKSNLGENVNFIVVFQTIEIERLSNEVELLRVKLKENERRLFNSQNYEVQIRELTEKCFNYENEREYYQEEFQKMNKICETLYHQNQSLRSQLSEMDFSLKQKYQSERQKNNDLLQEIQKWKARYQASQKSKAKELEELRNLMDSQRKSMIDREIREMTIRFQNERSNLESEIRKCRQMLNNRANEIEDYKQRCQKYEIDMMEYRNYEHIIAEHENKLVLLSNELLRLNQILRSRDDQIQSFKKREYDLNLKLKEQKEWEADNKNMKSLLDGRAKQIQEWKIRASRLEEEAIRAKEMVHYNNEMNDKLELASHQIQRLNSVLKLKLDQIEKWKQKLSSKDAELSQYKNLEHDVAQYQAKISMIKTQNDRINGILKSRLEEIENWKKKNNELENLLTKFGFVQKQKKTLEDKFNNQIKTNEELKFAFANLEKDNNALRRFEQRCKELENKNEALSQELNKMNNSIRNASQQLNDQRQRQSKLQSNLLQYKNIQVQLKDYQMKIVLLTQEIQRLNNLIRTKNQDIEQLEQQKLEMHSKISVYKNYQIKIQENEHTVSKLLNNIQICKRDVDNWQNKFRSSEAKTKELENNLFAFSQEKQKLGNFAKNKGQQVEEWKNKCINMQSELRRYGDMDRICQEQEKHIALQLSDLENLERKCRELETINNKEKNISNDLRNKLASTVSQLQRLSKELNSNSGKQSKEFQELQEHYSRLQTRVKSKDSQIELLASKITQLQSQCTNLSKEFQRLLLSVEQAYKDNLDLNKKIEEYQNYAQRIHILSAEMDRLNSINKGLEEDNKSMRLKYSNQMNSEKRQEDLNFMMILMSVEIESLRARVQQREVSMDEMRKSILEPVRRI